MSKIDKSRQMYIIYILYTYIIIYINIYIYKLYTYVTYIQLKILHRKHIIRKSSLPSGQCTIRKKTNYTFIEPESLTALLRLNTPSFLSRKVFGKLTVYCMFILPCEVTCLKGPSERRSYQAGAFQRFAIRNHDTPAHSQCLVCMCVFLTRLYTPFSDSSLHAKVLESQIIHLHFNPTLHYFPP